jgi:hypothetical protein
MNKKEAAIQAHPKGETQIAGNQPAEPVTSVDTFAGKVHVKWAPEAAVSSLGLMPFFIEFLKTSGLFEEWVADCPLHYTSGNAPDKRDVLGTLVLSVLAGHWRYAHINTIRADGINPALLGMKKVVSEDSAIRKRPRWAITRSSQAVRRTPITIRYHPHSGWFDEGPSKGPPPHERA